MTGASTPWVAFLSVLQARGIQFAARARICASRGSQGKGTAVSGSRAPLCAISEKHETLLTYHSNDRAARCLAVACLPKHACY